MSLPDDHAPLRLAYLCLQQTREGQASYAHVHEIVAGLRRRNIDVLLFEADVGDADPRAKTFRRVCSAAWTQFRAVRALRRVDVLYVRGHVLAAPLALLADLFAVPVVQEVNGPSSEMALVRPALRPVAALLERLVALQLRRAAAVVCVTDALARWVRGMHPRGVVEVITNGASAERFLTEPNRVQHPTMYVLFVGAFAPWQGLELMIEAASDPAWPVQVQLWIAGDGAGRVDVEAAERRSPERIVYLGPVPHAEIPRLTSGALAALSVQSSYGGRHRYGVMPLKVFEAMASGTAVVVSDIDGQAQVVGGARAGLVVPVDDPPAIARAVAELARSPSGAMTMGNRGREAVRSKHSWDRRAEDTAVLIRSLCRSSSSEESS